MRIRTSSSINICLFFFAFTSFSFHLISHSYFQLKRLFSVFLVLMLFHSLVFFGSFPHCFATFFSFVVRFNICFLCSSACLLDLMQIRTFSSFLFFLRLAVLLFFRRFFFHFLFAPLRFLGSFSFCFSFLFAYSFLLLFIYSALNRFRADFGHVQLLISGSCVSCSACCVICILFSDLPVCVSLVFVFFCSSFSCRFICVLFSGISLFLSCVFSSPVA